MAPAHAIRFNQAPPRSQAPFRSQAPPRFKVTKLAALKFKAKRPFKSAPRATRAKTPPPQEEILMSATLSDTITPNKVEETSSLSGRVNLEKLIAQLFKVQNRRDRHYSYKKRYKSRSRRYYRRYRYRYRYSNTSDTSDSFDSKSNHERRREISFRYLEGKKLFLSIAQKYSSVKIKYFKQIFFEIFQIKNFVKLTHMHIISVSDLNKNVSDHNYIIHYFHVYAIAIERFVHLEIKKELNETLHSYIIRLLRLSIIYRFDFILIYYLAFIIARIQIDQNVSTT